MPGSVLCEGCVSSLPFINLALACPRCGAPFGRTLCTECPMPGSESALLHPEEAFPFTQARAALSFEDGARRIISTYKDGDELRLDAVIASLLCAAIRGRTLGADIPRPPAAIWGKAGPSAVTSSEAERPAVISSEAERSREISSSLPLQDWTQWADALVYVPASPEALLRRGFDHMERVAEIVSRRTGMALVHALASCKGARDQRELGRGERLANRSGSFSLAAGVISDAGKLPRRIVLIDDVFTTGATLSAAAHALLDGGAHEIRTVTCCRVW